MSRAWETGGISHPAARVEPCTLSQEDVGTPAGGPCPDPSSELRGSLRSLESSSQLPCGGHGPREVIWEPAQLDSPSAHIWGTLSRPRSVWVGSLRAPSLHLLRAGPRIPVLYGGHPACGEGPACSPASETTLSKGSHAHTATSQQLSQDPLRPLQLLGLSTGCPLGVSRASPIWPGLPGEVSGEERGRREAFEQGWEQQDVRAPALSPAHTWRQGGAQGGSFFYWGCDRAARASWGRTKTPRAELRSSGWGSVGCPPAGRLSGGALGVPSDPASHKGPGEAGDGGRPRGPSGCS